MAGGAGGVFSASLVGRVGFFGAAGGGFAFTVARGFGALILGFADFGAGAILGGGGSLTTDTGGAGGAGAMAGGAGFRTFGARLATLVFFRFGRLRALRRGLRFFFAVDGRLRTIRPVEAPAAIPGTEGKRRPRRAGCVRPRFPGRAEARTPGIRSCGRFG